MIALIIILCLIAVCVIALLLSSKDEDIKPISSPKIYRRKLNSPENIKGLKFIEKNPVGVLKNGDVVYEDGKLYTSYNNKKVLVDNLEGTVVLNPNRTINFIPNNNPFDYPFFKRIGETFDIEEEFPVNLKNKIYRLFANEIYTNDRNRKDSIFYAQRCDVTTNGIAKIFNFKNQGVPFVIDPLGNKFYWLGMFKIINENGELVSSKLIHNPNSEMLCNEYGEIVFNVKISNSLEKLYAVWYISKSY